MKEKSNRTVPFILCLFFGTLGLHRFYLRKFKSAILMLATLGGFGIWYLIDLGLIATNRLQRKQVKAFSPAKKMA